MAIKRIRLKTCLRCGEPLPEGATKRRKFCSESCRVAMHQGKVPRLTNGGLRWQDMQNWSPQSEVYPCACGCGNVVYYKGIGRKTKYVNDTHRKRVQRGRPEAADPEYVYLLKIDNAYKIGKTIRPKSRLMQYQIAYPFEVSWECLIRVVDCSNTEAMLKAKFSDRWIRGEWYALQPEDVDFINGLVFAEVAA